jgi:uncharacterized protein
MCHSNPGQAAAAGCPDNASASCADQSRLCRECAQAGHTCCQEHDIYVTLGDCRRISKHTRQHNFYEYRGCADAAYADQADDPLWAQYVFRLDGSRRVLKRKANGDCIYLTDVGCQLPLVVRPLVCRLYPHVYSARGIDTAWDPDCPAARVTPAAMIETGIAGVEAQEAAQWHQCLYNEVLREGQDDENWIDL